MKAQHSESELAQGMGLESDQEGSSYHDQEAASMDMEQEQHPQSHLFTLRVWEEALGEGKVEWRGRVQEVASGETLFFRDWPGLIATLRRLIAKTTAAPEGGAVQRLRTHEDDE